MNVMHKIYNIYYIEAHVCISFSVGLREKMKKNERGEDTFPLIAHIILETY